MKSARNSIEEKIYGCVPQLVVEIGVVAIGAASIIHACLNFQAAASFWNNAIATTGTIVRTRFETITTSSGGTGVPNTTSFYISTIRFKTLQREIIKFESDPDMCVSGSDSGPCEGRKVEIVYNSRNPHQAIVKGSASPLVRVLTQIGISMFFVIFTIMIMKESEEARQSFDRKFLR
jgi:hypothetical protein